MAVSYLRGNILTTNFQENEEAITTCKVKLKPNDPEVLNFLNALEENRLPSHSMEWIPNQSQVERRNYPPRQPPNLLW